MPPLWQYFSRVWKKKAVEPIAAPKGSESRTPQTFSLQTAASWGPRRGPRWRSRTPLARTPFAASPAAVVGEGHAPVVAVLLTARKEEKPDEPIAAPKGHGPRTLRFSPPNWSLPGSHERGHDAGSPTPPRQPRRDGGRRASPVVAVLVTSYRAASTLTASPCVTKTSPLRGSAAAHTAPGPTGMDSTSRFVAPSMTSTVPSKNVGT
jgi:hypothetical protein